MNKPTIAVLLLAFLPLRCVLVLSLSTSPTTTHRRPLLNVPSGIAKSATYILEEQSIRKIPVDTALRRYTTSNAKQQPPSSRLDAEDQTTLRDLVLGIARHQYRIDWRLRDAGIECSPENRVAAALRAGYIQSSKGAGTFVMNTPYPSDVDFDTLTKGSGSSQHSLEVDGMDLQTRLECPDWAWPGLQDAFPSEKELSTELRAFQQAAPLDLRINTLKCEGREDVLRDIRNAGFEAEATPWSPLGIRFKERVALGKIPGLLAGVVEPQDEGSQLVAALLDARPGDVVADYCAGTGGKTIQIAAQMQNRGRLYSLDVDADRLERGRPRCAKANVSNVSRQTVQADMARKDTWCKRRKRTFDRVLVDAPCSGVGSWRRKPDARRTWASFDADADGASNGVERLTTLLTLQQQILRRASRLVKVGGRLVYVTCSLLPEENEHQIAQFLESDEGSAAGWRVDPPRDFCVPFEAGNGQFLRLTPAQHNTDGFFAAVFIRDELDGAK
jgi:16S rRNA (cytosine967-C5)-methyltransferase